MLHLSDSKGRFHLYSDTSSFATGSALYKIQNRKPKHIAFASKRPTEAAKLFYYRIRNVQISHKYC